MNKIYLDNDYDSGLKKVKKASDGSVLTSGTATVRLYEVDRTTALGAAVTLTPDGAGNYAGTLDKAVFSSKSLGTKLWVKHVFSQDGYDYTSWEEREVALRGPGA